MNTKYMMRALILAGVALIVVSMILVDERPTSWIVIGIAVIMAVVAWVWTTKK